MKKIFTEKTYDTETATELTHWTNGYDCKDLHYCYEGLYQTKKGNYFIYGKSGALGKYSKLTFRGRWTNGEEIIPISVRGAKSWAARYLDGDKYSRIFG